MRGDRSDGKRALRARGAGENLYIVAYDIADPRRWRRVFRLMNGYGEWLQLSVFQCRLNRRYRALIRRGKLKTVAVTAVARELAGFIWAIGREVTTADAAAR